MIIVDTNVWIDHFHRPDPTLSVLLGELRSRIHPYVLGEIALGALRDRGKTLGALSDLPRAELALHEEVLRLIADRGLHGLGIGYVDAHLLASALLTPGSRLWTHDKRLAAAAERMDVLFKPLH